MKWYQLDECLDAQKLIYRVSDANFAGFEITEAPHRTGAMEACLLRRSILRRRQVWRRGTNRVIAMCEKHDAALPIFEERQGFLIVTFKTSMVGKGVLEEGAQKSTQKTSDMILAILAANPSSTMARMAEELGIHPGAVKKHLRNLKKQGRL
jgi:hypothetical protein